ncbi:MAG: pyruvate ferredoxin oxidoreductase, partial [Anaerolineae bacterium]
LELLAALGAHDVRIPMTDYVYGLGGRDILPQEIERVFRDAVDVAETGQIERKVTYLSVRE